MKTKKPKKRNPQDATLTNIRALKKRVAELENDMDRAAGYLNAFQLRITNIESRLYALEKKP